MTEDHSFDHSSEVGLYICRMSEKAESQDPQVGGGDGCARFVSDDRGRVSKAGLSERSRPSMCPCQPYS